MNPAAYTPRSRSRSPKCKGGPLARMKLKTDDGQALTVHLPPVLTWLMGLASAAIIAGTTTIINVHMRVNVLEDSALTMPAAVELHSEFVPRLEYESRWNDATNRLDRIESKLDRLLEARD